MVGLGECVCVCGGGLTTMTGINHVVVVHTAALANEPWLSQAPFKKW